MTTWKKVLLIAGLVIAGVSTTLGGIGATQTHDSIRLVDFLKIFAGGFALGVTLMGALRARRSAAPAKSAPPPSPKSGA